MGLNWEGGARALGQSLGAWGAHGMADERRQRALEEQRLYAEERLAADRLYSEGLYDSRLQAKLAREDAKKQENLAPMLPESYAIDLPEQEMFGVGGMVDPAESFAPYEGDPFLEAQYGLEQQGIRMTKEQVIANEVNQASAIAAHGRSTQQNAIVDAREAVQEEGRYQRGRADKVTDTEAALEKKRDYEEDQAKMLAEARQAEWDRQHAVRVADREATLKLQDSLIRGRAQDKISDKTTAMKTPTALRQRTQEFPAWRDKDTWVGKGDDKKPKLLHIPDAGGMLSEDAQYALTEGGYMDLGARYQDLLESGKFGLGAPMGSYGDALDVAISLTDPSTMSSHDSALMLNDDFMGFDDNGTSDPSDDSLMVKRGGLLGKFTKRLQGQDAIEELDKISATKGTIKYKALMNLYSALTKKDGARVRAEREAREALELELMSYDESGGETTIDFSGDY